MKKVVRAAGTSAFVAVVAMGVLSASGCSSGHATHPALDGGGPGSDGAAAEATSGRAADAGVSVTASGLATIEPSVPTPPAVQAATPELTLYPSARLETGSASDAVYSIVDVESSGSVRYVDAYTVAFLCGPGVPDDCEDFVGTPELRIPIAPDATFRVFDASMRPDKATDFTGFRAFAAGPKGDFSSGWREFEITIGPDGQATGFTVEYKP